MGLPSAVAFFRLEGSQAGAHANSRKSLGWGIRAAQATICFCPHIQSRNRKSRPRGPFSQPGVAIQTDPEPLPRRRGPGQGVCQKEDDKPGGWQCARPSPPIQTPPIQTPPIQTPPVKREDRVEYPSGLTGGNSSKSGLGGSWLRVSGKRRHRPMGSEAWSVFLIHIRQNAAAAITRRPPAEGHLDSCLSDRVSHR